jgi:hypothetical protein
MHPARRIWFFAIVQALFLFPACKSTHENTAKTRILNNTASVKKEPLYSDLSGEARFFKFIFAKYPELYYPLGSSMFLESYSRGSGTLRWKFSFMVIDTTVRIDSTLKTETLPTIDTTLTDEKLYLVEITDTVISRFLPDVHFYSGKHTHHWEIGGELSFYGFVNKYTADFIYDQYEDGYSPSFKQMIGAITFKDETEKTQFRAAFQERFLIDPFKEL